MVKHGRKEQFSITIASKLADKIYEYIEKNDILYKNLAFEQLLSRAFNHIELMVKYDENQWKLFLHATDAIANIVFDFAPKNKTLKKYLKLHYENLRDIFHTTKISEDIP